jgi:hypothetical protein
MGLLEYFFERKNPGNVGSIQREKQTIKYISLPLVLIKIIISAFFVFGLFYLTVWQNLSIINILIFIIILIFYCVISYQVIPRPDTTNMGLLGGLIDHPFKYTDDMNRFLLLLSVLMYPGRFVSTTIMQTLMLLKRSGRK